MREIKFRIVHDGTVYGTDHLADLCLTKDWLEDWGGNFTKIEFNQYTGLKSVVSPTRKRNQCKGFKTVSQQFKKFRLFSRQ